MNESLGEAYPKEQARLRAATMAILRATGMTVGQLDEAERQGFEVWALARRDAATALEAAGVDAMAAEIARLREGLRIIRTAATSNEVDAQSSLAVIVGLVELALKEEANEPSIT